jgi:molybdopterin-binding protein
MNKNNAIEREAGHMKISARNQLKGKVVEIESGSVNAIVTIDIGGGNFISATISMASVKNLKLEVGSDAYAIIKATSVMVGIDS